MHLFLYPEAQKVRTPILSSSNVCLTTGLMQFWAVLPRHYNVFCKALYIPNVMGMFCKDHDLAMLL